MAKKFSLSITLVIIITLYVISLIFSIIYLLYYVDKNNISYIILIICIIYFSFFIFLTLIAIIDLSFNNSEKFEILFKIIPQFYIIFSYISKILGIVIFTIWINFLESGYYSKSKKFCEFLIRIFYKIKKAKTCLKIVISISTAILLPTIIILYIIFKDKLGLKSPIYYICIFIDCYSIFYIYIYVGFFIAQLFIDCKRQKNEDYINRYYRYSKRKIIEETDKIIDNIDNSKKKLNEVQKLEKNNSSLYDYYQKLIDKGQEIIKQYESQDNNDNININGANNINNNKNFNNDNSNIKNNTINNITDINNNTNTNNTNYNFNENNHSLHLNSPKEEEIRNNKLKDQKEQIQKEVKKEDLPTIIRKYKKSIRRINKMKKLNKDIENEKEKDLKKSEEKKNAL